MKRERIATAAWALVLGFCMSFSAVGGLVSAFSMAVSVSRLAFLCLIASAVAVICYSLPLKLLPLGGFAVALGYYWRSGDLELSVESLLYRLSFQYNKGYQWPIIRWSGRLAEEMESTLPLILCLLAVALAFSICRSICRRKSLLSGALFDLLCLAPCFVLNDTVPKNLYLFLQLLSVVTLILTCGVRRRSAEAANKLMAITLPVTALALLVLFACAPRKDYSSENAKRLGDWFVNTRMVQSILGKKSQDNQSVDANTVDLTQVGYRIPGTTRLLSVKADFTNTLYLRGKAHDYYDGVSWSRSQKIKGDLNWPTDLESAGVVEISTKYAHNMLYVPYYAASASMRESAYGVSNGMKLTEYSFGVRKALTHAALNQYQADSQNLEGTLTRYIDLPEDVKSWAKPLATKITNQTTSVYRKAELLASYVRSSASYDTDTPRMGAREKDFARWFLEKSDSGYCVHFATATTVLLQAIGVPARYVTGYMVQAVAGQEVEVTGEQAHAWCEYWLPGYGWTVLEATPPDLRPQPTEATTKPATHPTEMPEQTLPDKVPNQVTPPQNVTETNNLLPLTALIVGLVAMVWLQYGLRRHLQRKRLRRGDSNRQTLTRWRYAQTLAKHLKQTPPEQLQALAEKAKFSQYVITPEELAVFEKYETDAISNLKRQNIFLRIYHCLILVLY